MFFSQKTIVFFPLYFLMCCLILSSRPVFAIQNITALWANDGEDKVTQDELRATHGNKVTNLVWDGTKVSIFGGRNEVVAFNLILEASSRSTGNISVSFNQLKGPSGATIVSTKATGNGVFDWTHRDIELFYVRYLPIKGLSLVSYGLYDERHIPQRLRRPWTGNGAGSGIWQDRPDHDKFYPEIAVPLELVPTFTIAAGHNQSIWVDIYIPKTVPPGNYLGTLIVQENGAVAGSIPVQLKVYNFTLPDVPSVKVMTAYSAADINHRYLGATYASPASAAGAKAILLRDRHYLLAHRHKISLIGDSPGDCDSTEDNPCPESVPRLTGSLFTASNGYDGPGVNIGTSIYSIGTYGSWSWSAGTESDMNQHTNAWVTWFAHNIPGAEYFLYLSDESSDYVQTQTWAHWILNNPGVGRQLKSMATISLPTAAAQTPALDIPTSTLWVGIPAQWQPLADQYSHDARKRFYMYNGHRPGSGSFATEDDGVALRELAWGQYKKHINRWFFWESTYYNNSQGGAGETNVFQTAQTFGTHSSQDSIIGQTGWNYSNGDGVLFYPGTDAVYPADSYGVDGPFASLRLKYWRRGIQDADYLTLASAVNSGAVQAIINRIIPKALWEYGVDNPSDPTYLHADISWSNNPDVWETARTQLAEIIVGTTGGGGVPESLPAPTLNLPSTLTLNASITAGYPSGYNIVGFQWAFIPQTSSTHTQAGIATNPGPTSGSSFMTPSATTPLASLSLSAGNYQISVWAVDGNNTISPPGVADVTLVEADSSGLVVYPNPWRADRHGTRPITFDHLAPDTTVKIFTTSGHLVKTLPRASVMTTWDLTNDSGDKVASGLYLYVAKAADDTIQRGQVAIIK